jgi:copper chaperone
MEILKFKTNVTSSQEVSALSPFLNEESAISRWKLDTESPDKVLSVSGHELDPQRVKNLVEKAGYKAEVIQVLGAGGVDL